MDAERWKRIEELFLGALPLDSEARRSYIDDACGPDTDLRREVGSLLAQGENAQSFLESRQSAATQTMQSGKAFGPYRILSPLGSGGMGEVYRAHDSKLNRDVAVKALPPAFAFDPERLARFQREARTLASLNHPNIAAIYGLEESAGATYLILELVEGETLRGPVPLKTALDYARQIADALEAAHEKRIIHRDLKPANIKVTPRGRVKILDFGLAKALSNIDGDGELSPLPAVSMQQTLVGQIVGTPAYMSPEQARGTTVDHRTDIWAFGCVLYELLANKRAFTGEALADTFQAVFEKEPDWSALPSKTPPRIRALLRRCLEKTPARRLQDIRAVREEVRKVQQRPSGWRIAAFTAPALAVMTLAAVVLLSPVRFADRSEWVQVTNFPDSVSQPSLSPDGRMLTFVRGPATFSGPGEIYIKILSTGESVQLTNDKLEKMSPVFSLDGSRIAYAVGAYPNWDTWTVSTIKGAPRLWLSNSSGLIWLDKGTLLYSALEKDIHIGVAAAAVDGGSARKVYLPDGRRSAAHRAHPSPDGKWALIAELDRGIWQPCRVVPIDGSGVGRNVGPPNAGCTSAAWSPDGKWMYLTSTAGGGNHIWRQRFLGGQPEQVTSGPTEEEGIATAPDGRSLITAVGLRQSVVWLHDRKGERQISVEGYAVDPKFTPDGKKLFYRILKGVLPFSAPGELQVVDLASGQQEPVLPGLDITGQPRLAYDISSDGAQVVAGVQDREGRHRLWIGALEGQQPPRQITAFESDYPHFGADNDIFFRGFEGPSAYIYRIKRDGSGLQKVIQQPVAGIRTVSPDGQWLIARVQEENASATIAFPLGGGAPRRLHLGAASFWNWSADRTRLYLSIETHSTSLSGRTYVIPLSAGQMLPPTADGKDKSREEFVKVPGVEVIEAFDVAAGPVPGVYAFSRESVQRNLYRIPLH